MTRELIKDYLAKSRVMQIATISGGRPWICTVYFVEDDGLNLYWMSLPMRRHSRDIEKHPHVAAAITVKYDKPVIGIQIEGQAEIVTDVVAAKSVVGKYVEKYDTGKQFYDNTLNGTNQHKLYHLRPARIVLFDEVNFKGDPTIGKEYKISR
ncbi:MAG: pyridoxamine 5'-phosphate oxidase family protein [Acidobacteriota bacterium]